MNEINNYNSNIFKIISSSCKDNEIYIGSTTKDLNKILNLHKLDYKMWKNGKNIYRASFILFNKYGVDNCKIILLENINALSYDEIFARKEYYIKTLKCINNILSPIVIENYRKHMIKYFNHNQ
jgi:hypothetical protein